ncbi:unnamed protein product [Rotaria magnacalcarata]|uniref:Uncharacterized protein n=2 Tax=Rotaria magnacalcarata TaxID=392030 RepID=A0A8S3F9G6_9BILA|nr:unnamed protein product [Rotaria magnacalcarata]CAF5110819.1 unnamed protein product [Rotaria magnacalcarata]CAF5204044.1 unnamed protein product [Rotaria magnacalcarata]
MEFSNQKWSTTNSSTKSIESFSTRSAIELKIDFEQIKSVNKYNHYRRLEDDLDEEYIAWLKNTKMIAPIVERFQELYDHVVCA